MIDRPIVKELVVTDVAKDPSVSWNRIHKVV